EIFWSRIVPEDRELARVALDRALSTRGAYDCQFRVCLPDNSLRWIVAKGHVEEGENHQLKRLRGACVDVTERHRAEVETQELREELAHIARISTLGELATSVAHELNQPLGAILSNAEAAELFLKQDPPALDEVRAILTDIRKDDERAGEV